jgi:iron complex transport system substrate-binding protein
MRIVSLLPSATEIVCALGFADSLVGISHECDFPEAIRDRRVLTKSRVTGGSSAAIDEAVRFAIRDALAIYEVDERALAELAPDVIVTQDLCEVCAVSLDDVRAAVARLAHREHIEIASLRPMRLADVLGDLERVAAVLGAPERGRRVVGELQARITAIASRVPAQRPRVVTLEWLEPLMIGGTWMPELVELAGGDPIGARAGEHAPTVSAQMLGAMRPDVVAIKPCGFTIERSLEERGLIDRIAALVPGARVYLTDGNAFFNRPGPRIVESLEILAACVHPEAFADLAGKHASSIVRIA